MSPPRRTARPTSSGRTVSRPRLHEKLDSATQLPLTIISAGPGWGKSTAVADWIESGNPGLPVVWLTLSSSNDTLPGFLEAVITAIRESGALPDGHRLHRTSTAGGINSEVLAALWLAVAEINEPLLLVLDDFHVVEDPEALRLVQQLAMSDGRVHLMLLTRFEPTLALHRMRLECQVAQISAADLAFRPGEAQAMARADSQALTDGELDTVLTRTEGWPAGVRLALLHLSRAQVMTDFAGTEQSVAEFLAAEVLARNKPETREFLLRTSVAPLISSELASAIVGQVSAQSTLEMLERTNQFVTALGTDRAWFRYHPLLRDLLQHMLRRDDPDGFVQAHRATARWLSDNGEPVDALGHAAAAADWELFGGIYAGSAAPALVGVRRPAIQQQLQAVPYTQLAPSAELQLCVAGLSLMAGQLDAMDEHALAAVSLMEQGHAGSPAARALTAVMQGASARHRGQLGEAIRACQTACAIIDAADPFPASDSYRAIAANTRGVALLWTGALDTAAESLEATQVLAPSADIDITRMTARSHLAVCELLRANLDESRDIADAVTEDATAKGWRSMFWLRPAFCTLALEHLLRGELDEADSAVVYGLAAHSGGREPAPALLIRIAQGFAAVSRGREKSAERAADEVLQRITSSRPPHALADEVVRMLTDVELLTGLRFALPASLATGANARDSHTIRACRARRLLADGNVGSAVEVAQSVDRDADPTTLADLLALIEARIVLAVAMDRDRHRYEALQALESAVEAARERGIVRPFQIAGPAILPLLHMVDEGKTTGDEFISDVLRHCGERRSPGPDALSDALTEREQAVLRELSTMKSNAEIADEFFVSVNTIKSHLKSIFRKLEVNTRREAVRRGRHHGLVR